jgi:hypothetical protein
MLAIAERAQQDLRQAEVLVWHKPVGRSADDFQAIACSTEYGIVLPGSKRDVPISLDKPGERWCPDCLAAIRTTEK